MSEKFYTDFTAATGREPLFIHFWGLSCYSLLEQAIEKVGLQDLQKLTDTIGANEWVTEYGAIKFENMNNVNFTAGSVGQWQDGIFTSIAPKESRMAAPLYPKPAWPEKKKKK